MPISRAIRVVASPDVAARDPRFGALGQTRRMGETGEGRDLPIQAIAMSFTAVASFFNAIGTSSLAIRALCLVILVAALVVGVKDFLRWRRGRSAASTM